MNIHAHFDHTFGNQQFAGGPPHRPRSSATTACRPTWTSTSAPGWPRGVPAAAANPTASGRRSGSRHPPSWSTFDERCRSALAASSCSPWAQGTPTPTWSCTSPTPAAGSSATWSKPRDHPCTARAASPCSTPTRWRHSSPSSANETSSFPVTAPWWTGPSSRLSSQRSSGSRRSRGRRRGRCGGRGGSGGRSSWGHLQRTRLPTTAGARMPGPGVRRRGERPARACRRGRASASGRPGPARPSVRCGEPFAAHAVDGQCLEGTADRAQQQVRRPGTNDGHRDP